MAPDTYHGGRPPRRTNLGMTAEELRSWRKAHGYSLRQLADRLDIHYQSVYRWEKGINPMPGRWLDLALERLACDATARPPVED